jgi:hypothetical protein
MGRRQALTYFGAALSSLSLPLLDRLAMAADASTASPKVGYLHTVLFSFNKNITPAEYQPIIASIRSQADLPGVQSMILAPNLDVKSNPSAWQWLLMLDFETQETSKAFQSSAAHKGQIKAVFEKARSGFIMVDLHQPFDRKIADARGNEIREIEVFNFKSGLTEADRDHVMAAIAEQGQLPGVARLVAGKNAFDGGEKAEFSFLDWMVLREFATEADQKAFARSAGQRAFRRDIFDPAIDGRPVVSRIRLSDPTFKVF